ncbi:hypothetical protein [Chryseobacterium wangxinyae]|uniref:hypothetical protein n=1 Tax=unclassified Chryseobacterium TaxID=2593645 RepID=UPI0022701975|nr:MULTISPECIES: hypothetical protein [unclassified Chryseobacterium]MCY0970827.1 hypothetical protein [Chryseobacterium sp. CY353]MCY0979236.1 hypothetical protein [Chryseobacterium sp. CY350]WBZ95868.1 hypothetical protein PGH12_01665 [Chryseobacterium sp. CY350]
MKKILTTLLMSLVFGFAQAQYSTEDEMHIYNFTDPTSPSGGYRFFTGIVTAINPNNCTPVVQGQTAAYIYPGESTVYKKFQGSGSSYIPINSWTVYTGTSTQNYNQSSNVLTVFEPLSRWGGFLAEYLDAATLSYGENIEIGYGYNGYNCYNYGLNHTDSYINAYSFYVPSTNPNAENYYVIIQ